MPKVLISEDKEIFMSKDERIYTIPDINIPKNIATEQAMDEVLIGNNVGAVYRYIGNDSSIYVYDNLYIVEAK